MLSIFGTARTSRVLGIEFSSTTVKLLELSRDDERYRVDSYAIAPLPSGALTDDPTTYAETVGAFLEELLSRTKLSANRAVAAVSGADVIIKTVVMPTGLPEEDLEAQLTVEADQYIPYPLDEVALDFEELGPAAGRDEQVNVLLVACRQESIDSRVDAIEVAGLVPKIIDVEVFALERAMALLQSQLPISENQTIAMVDIGASTTTLSVFAGGESVYTREQIFGGKQLTDSVISRYELSADEAGLAIRQGGLPDDYERELLNPFREAVVQQVSRSLQEIPQASNLPSIQALQLNLLKSSVNHSSTL